MDGEAGGGVGVDIVDGGAGGGVGDSTSSSSDAREPVSEEGDDVGDDEGGVTTTPMSMPSRRRTTAPRLHPRLSGLVTASPSSSPVGLGLDSGCHGGIIGLLRGRRLLLVVVVGSAAAAAIFMGVVPRRWSVRRGHATLENDRPFPLRRHPPRRILVVGLIADLGDLLLPTEEEGEGASDEQSHRRPFAEGNGVVEGLVGLCSATRRHRRQSDEDYGEDGGGGDEGGSGVDVHVTYRHGGAGGHDDVADALRGILVDAGCLRVRLEKEEEAGEGVGGGGDVDHEDVSRYVRLARLRSRQRSEILSEKREYDAVVNVDLDVLSLPPVPVMLDAVEDVIRLSSSSTNEDDGGGGHGEASGAGGAVVCANGYETWPFIRRARLYYDTLASVDADGDWYYRTYSLDPMQVVTFGQARLFRRISAFASTESGFGADADTDADGETVPLWPMRSCFGGMAVYDFATWSAERCDYDRDGITLLVDDEDDEAEDDAVVATSDGEEGSSGVAYWRPSGLYTLDGTSGGDACEHVVFQMCLAAMYRYGVVGGVGDDRGDRRHSRATLTVGIQPDLVVGREANFSVSFTEDWARVSEGAAIVVVPLLVVLSVVTRRFRRRCCRHGAEVAGAVPAAAVSTREVLPLLRPSGKDKAG